jgi:hypothetical protein
MTPDIPKSFNWVKARSECSLREVFLCLAEVIESDVKAFNELPNVDAKISVNRATDEKIVVVKTWKHGGVARNIVFDLTDKGIAAKSGGANEKRLFLARPSLLQSGECKLEVEGISEPLELWQVSRKGLEELFFG